MAAYAALMSLMHTIHQIQHHPLPPISLHEQQLQSLSENIAFLQEFLEAYNFQNGGNSDEDGLESRIAKAAYTAEDNIETHAMIQIRYGSTSEIREKVAADFYGGLQKIIEDMDSIKKEAMELKQDQMQMNSMDVAASSKSSSTRQSDTTVGIDEVLYEVMDKLTAGPLHRRVIPIVGMGGIGKTTLARNIYQNPIMVEHFHILAWITISREFNMKKFNIEFLQDGRGNSSEENKLEDEDIRGNLSEENKLEDEDIRGNLSEEKKDGESELEGLHKKLSGRRYLIVVDDIWDIKGWDELIRYLPNDNKGSRVVVTTRLSNLAGVISDSHGIEMRFLDEYNSWNLLCKIVFGNEDCPPELEKTGRNIVESCKGLPLSITVIGGLLGRSEKTQQYWDHTAENLSSIVNLEDDERCLRILHTSYSNLPVYLKPCFLYLCVFKEDSHICASKLAKLWVAEGILKPADDRGLDLEDVAEECLEELVDRNLILVEKRNHCGKLKLFKIHDLLRDLCLREAREQKFVCVPVTASIPPDLEGGRRVSLYEMIEGDEYPAEVLDELQNSLLTRSLIWVPYLPAGTCLPLLRVYSTENLSCQRLLDDTLWRVNSRYISVRRNGPALQFPSSIYSHLWNLQTLLLCYKYEACAPSEIWNMSQLRHVEIRPSLELPDPPTGDVCVLENLQTLLIVKNFKWSEQVVKRIPNIKKLKICVKKGRLQDYCLDNIGHLHRLSSLSLVIYGSVCVSSLEMSFPVSLKKLSLFGTRLQWEDMTKMMGLLPLLQVLKLRGDACIGAQWHTVEGQFRSLVFLEILSCDLEEWETDNSHFPRLERLHLLGLKVLKEVPSSIGDIATLQLICLVNCSYSASESAKIIREEQEDLANMSLRVLLSSQDVDEEEGEDEN